MVAHVQDSRIVPQIPTCNIFLCVFGMFTLRLPSFNELEQRLKIPHLWESFVGKQKPSADTLGYSLERFDLDTLRDNLSRVAHQAKRKKALKRLSPTLAPYWVAAVDGNELWCSESRCCDRCLIRDIETAERIVRQYYHRVVVLQMVDVSPALILDIEPILPGEDEVAAATRILKRLRQRYPRFLDILTADALYLRAPFIQTAMEAGLDVVIVLKQENRELYRDVEGLLGVTKPTQVSGYHGPIQRWDIENLTSWTQLGKSVRVVRSLEDTTERVRIARTWKEETIQRDWRWMTSLPSTRASTEVIARCGHARWDIENRGFNELTQHWAMDHCFHHEPNTIVAILLILALAFSLTTFFFDRNLKPQVRDGHTRLFLAHRLADDLIQSAVPSFWSQPP